jgi:ketosteroid isomerase-like protein
MSQEKVEIVRAFYDRWDARDLAPAFELLASNVEWHTAPTSLSAGKALHGVEAVLRHMDELRSAEQPVTLHAHPLVAQRRHPRKD